MPRLNGVVDPRLGCIVDVEVNIIKGLLNCRVVLETMRNRVAMAT